MFDEPSVKLVLGQASEEREFDNVVSLTFVHGSSSQRVPTIRQTGAPISGATP